MFANVLTHPSTPISCKSMVAVDNLPLDELPALLHQSLQIWEQIFARQESVQREPATTGEVKPPASAISHT